MRLQASVLLFGVLALTLSACSNYGEKVVVNEGEVYYTEGISEEMAQDLGNFLVASGYFDGEPKSVQLTKDENDGYVFRMVFQEEAINDPQYEQLAKVFSNQISQEILNGEPVTMEFTNTTFETQKSIAFEPMKLETVDEIDAIEKIDTNAVGDAE